jgi:hypothetical protein
MPQPKAYLKALNTFYKSIDFLYKERAMYKDKWEEKDKEGNVVQEKEGLGLKGTI